MMDGIQPLCAFRDEGIDARDNGQLVSACPYPIGTDEHQEWQEGWHERDGLEENDTKTVERFLPREG
jgi:ribosome modulation factor